MVYIYDDNDEKIVYDYTTNTWKYPDEEDMINIDGCKRRICGKCGKPSISVNGVCDVDFCLQGLTSSDFITNACCGHGDDRQAYISLADGRRFILDKDWSRKEENNIQLEGIPIHTIVVDELPECTGSYFGLIVVCEDVEYTAVKNKGGYKWWRLQ